MENKVVKLLFALSLLLPAYTVYGQEDLENDSCQEVTRGCGKKSKKFCKICVCSLRAAQLLVTGNSAIDGDLAVGGNAALDGDLAVAGNEAVAGDLAVAGTITASNLTVTGTITGPGGSPIGAASLGYAYACNTAAQVVPAGGIVTFNLSASPAAGIIPPAPAGATFTILTSGVYYIQYQVRGTPGTLTPPSALQFTVLDNGTPLACSTYASDVQSTSLAADGTEAVNGYTIVSLTAGDVITLQNITLSSADSVTLAAVPVGGTSAVNASMLITRLA